MSGIEAVYIYDEHNNLLIAHTYSLRPPSPQPLIQAYLTHPSPRPSFLFLPSTSPPCTLHTHISDSLLLLSPTTTDVPPLLVLEFLHRLTDSLRDFLGSPLLSSRIDASPDLCAQLLAEACDAGFVATTEPNALRDAVEAPSAVTRLLGGTTPSLSSAAGGPDLALAQTPNAVPWRRANVRHTSNELYVDLVEEVQVTCAPSGRPLAAFVHGSVAFTCKVSGVPDMVLTLRTDGGGGGGGGERGERVRRTMQRPVFHPCVRLARWRSHGELSFVPPDGRFVLAGYEADMLEGEEVLGGKGMDLPAKVDVTTGLGDKGNEFEVRLSMEGRWKGAGGFSPAGSRASSQLNLPASARSSGRLGAAAGLGGFAGGQDSSSKGPAVLEDLRVEVPLPSTVRKIPDLRASKGEAHFSPADSAVTWTIPGKVASQISSAVLRCTVVGSSNDDPDTTGGGGRGEGAGDDGPASGLNNNGRVRSTYDYDEGGGATGGYQEDMAERPQAVATTAKEDDGDGDDARRDAVKANNDALMPRSVNMSFSIKGWLASGLRVDSLVIDAKRSRGLGEGVKPYKGVKYLTVSRRGVEVRC